MDHLLSREFLPPPDVNEFVVTVQKVRHHSY